MSKLRDGISYPKDQNNSDQYKQRQRSIPNIVGISQDCLWIQARIYQLKKEEILFQVLTKSNTMNSNNLRDIRQISPHMNVGTSGYVTPIRGRDVGKSTLTTSSVMRSTSRKDNKFLNTNQTMRRSQIFDASKYVCQELDVNEVIQLKEVFNRWDQEGNGSITPKDMRLALMQYDKNIMQPQVIQIFQLLDKQGKGEIQFEEFINIFKTKTMNESIEKIYYMYDIEKKGYICLQDLVNFTQRKLQKKEDEQLLRDIITFAGTDNKIYKTQFINIMQQYFKELK